MTSHDTILLPPPREAGSKSLEETLARRRSVRSFSKRPIPIEAIGQLLWAGQGVTAEGGRRTAPSAGALFGLEIYVACAEYLARYRARTHELSVLRREDVRGALARAAWSQSFIRRAPLVVALTGVLNRIAGKYGEERGARYLAMEAGHAAQNILLQAEALGYASVPVGAFDDGALDEVLGLGVEKHTLYLLPIGIAA
jgi:SagB-type dehydrogenase family enzyme